LIGPLPESNGFDAIMVVVDSFTKMKIFIPTNITLTALGAAELFKNHAFKRFGLPEGIVSDRGGQFVSEFTNELWKSLGIKGKPSTAYHPQTDGQTE
jgi:Integrase core domain